MKKILLISAMALLLFGMLALCAFAEGIVNKRTDSDEYGTVIQLTEDPGLDNAAQYVSTLKKINDAGTDNDALCILTDGNTDSPSYYVFPSSYIVDEREDGVFDIIATDLAASMAEFNTANGTSYYAEYATDGSGGGKRLDKLVRFVFPNSVTSANASICCIRSYSRLVEIRMNQSVDYSKAEKMFYSNKKLSTFIGFELTDGTKLPKTMFAACSALRYIKLPANTTKIPGSFFQGAQGVNVVNMEELTQLTVIEAWAFDGTQNLVITLPDSVTTLYTSAFESAFKQGGSITINPTSQLTTIGNKAFSGSIKLNSIYIPSTVTSIGENAFSGSGITKLENFENCQITVIKVGTFERATKLTSIKFPETVTTVEDGAFSGNTSLTRVYVPTSVTSFGDAFYMGMHNTATSPNLVVLYLGDDVSLFENCTGLEGANIIPAVDYDENGNYTGMNIVWGYSHCMAYNGGVHGESEIATVVTSYLADIKVVSKCMVCGMMDENGKIPALFVCQGYSVSETGTAGIVIGYVVNRYAIYEYSDLSGKALTYGVFAVSQAMLGDNTIFDECGTPAAGVVAMETSKYEFCAFTIKVTGITAETADIKLALGAYVAVTDDVATEYFYLQPGKPAEDERYCFVSYNDITGKSSVQ